MIISGLAMFIGWFIQYGIMAKFLFCRNFLSTAPSDCLNFHMKNDDPLQKYLFSSFYFSSSSLESLKFRHSEHTRKYSARFAAFERYQVISTFIHLYTQKFQGMMQEYLLRTICWEFVLKIWWFFNTNLKYFNFLNKNENHGNMKNIGVLRIK